MKCSDVEERLIDHAHDELEGDVRATVGRHLADCPSCALEYCRLQADLRGILEAHAEAPRARVFHQLRRRVAQEVRPPLFVRASRAFLRPVPAYGAVLFALLPAGLWILTAWVRPAVPGAGVPESSGPPSSPSSSFMPTITDYDATAVPVAQREVL
jgi:anti-sigma factor RsiW